MSNNLYWVPILLEALNRLDDSAGLRQAFEQIVETGKDPAYAKGYGQFLVFMKAVAAADSGGIPDEAPGKREEMPAGLRDLPDLEQAWADVQEDIGEVEGDWSAVLVLCKDGGEARTLALCQGAGKAVLQDLTPGQYELSLDSGRVVWEACLAKQDLLLAYAFPDEPLRVAADTGMGQEMPSLRELPLDGELEVTVFPGRTAGRLELRWHRR